MKQKHNPELKENSQDIDESIRLKYESDIKRFVATSLPYVIKKIKESCWEDYTFTQRIQQLMKWGIILSKEFNYSETNNICTLWSVTSDLKTEAIIIEIFINNILINIDADRENNNSDFNIIFTTHLFSVLCHELAHFFSTDVLEPSIAKAVLDFSTKISKKIPSTYEAIPNIRHYRSWISMNAWKYKYFTGINEWLTDLIWEELFNYLKEEWFLLNLWEYQKSYLAERQNIKDSCTIIADIEDISYEKAFEMLKKAYFIWWFELSRLILFLKNNDFIS